MAVSVSAETLHTFCLCFHNYPIYFCCVVDVSEYQPWGSRCVALYANNSTQVVRVGLYKKSSKQVPDRSTHPGGSYGEQRGRLQICVYNMSFCQILLMLP